MRILVVCSNYPNSSGVVSHMFAHVRNKYYISHNNSVTVLNFKAIQDYIYDGINVVTLKSFKKSNDHYDILICHAPNIRRHYRFLRKYDSNFKKIVFFFHGHEVLKINEAYPKPYSYMKKKSVFTRFAQQLYDIIKIKTWKRYILKNKSKLEMIFVSNWLKNQFLKNSGLKFSENMHVINNSVGPIFEEKQYCVDCSKKYDAITIRNNMDESKYCIDLVTKLAEKNTNLKFLVIGKGKYYNNYKKPQNIEWRNTTLTHQEMIELLDASKCGILLTREDTQGVMACEFATFGIPLISSDIDVCQEILGDLSNVKLIKNDNMNIDLQRIIMEMNNNYSSNKETRFFAKNTIIKELEIITR